MDNNNKFLVVKNIVFSNGMADHASISGRVCLAISNANDILTLIPLSHILPNTNESKYYTFDVYKNDINIYKKKTNIFKYYRSYLKIRETFQREIYFFDSVAELDELKYYYLLDKLLKLEFSKYINCKNIYESIYGDLLEQKNNLELKLKIKE